MALEPGGCRLSWRSQGLDMGHLQSQEHMSSWGVLRAASGTRRSQRPLNQFMVTPPGAHKKGVLRGIPVLTLTQAARETGSL